VAIEIEEYEDETENLMTKEDLRILVLNEEDVVRIYGWMDR
jgi:hypothetical protein